MVIGAIGVDSSGKPAGPELLSDRNGSIQATHETTDNGRPTSALSTAPH